LIINEDNLLIFSILKTALEVSINDIYTIVIDFPKRPPWHYEMTKEELETNEVHYFQQWLDDVYDEYPREELSFFEHNLDVNINYVIILDNFEKSNMKMFSIYIIGLASIVTLSTYFCRHVSFEFT